MKKTCMNIILRSDKTVFTFKELLLELPGISPMALRRRISYHVAKGDLYHIRRGIYAKDKDYNPYELATKIFTPSYLSFETVLLEAGIIFQYSEIINVATYRSKELVCDQRTFLFRKLKYTILINTDGLENRQHYFIASPERAFLDTLYLNKDYHFDNLSILNWKKVNDILPIYGSDHRMKKQVKRLITFTKEQAHHDT